MGDCVTLVATATFMLRKHLADVTERLLSRLMQLFSL